MLGVANKLKCPHKTDWFLGSRRDAWCEFHRAFGHNIKQCIALGFQLASLVKEGFLKLYLKANQEKPKGEAGIKDQTNETLVNGDLNNIVEGFSRGGSLASDRDKKEEDFTNGGRGHPPKHLKFFLLVFSKIKRRIK